MSNQEEEMKYRVQNQHPVQGQVIGDHAIVSQHFHQPLASTNPTASSSSDVVILTALREEFQAVVAHLLETQEVVHPETGTIYLQGNFSGKQGTWRVAVAQIGMGGLSAASETERASNLFHPRLMLFVGIAGGLKDVRHGDVVVATKVYAYESGKAAARFKPRPEAWRASYALVQRAGSEANDEAWLLRLKDQHPDPIPRVLLGPLAAGEKVLSDQRSSVYRFLQTTYSDSLAVEMEGHGFLQAVHANQHIYALVIRGISDLINDKLVAGAAGMQEKAARHAAAFAFQVLAKLILPSDSRPKLLPEEVGPEHKIHREQTDSTYSESLSQSPIHGPSKMAESERGHADVNNKPNNRRNMHKWRIFVSAAILLLLMLSLVPFFSSSGCFFASCHPSQPPTKQPVVKQDLSMKLIDVLSPSVVLPNNLQNYSPISTSPASIGAILLKNTSTYYKIIMDVTNLRSAGADILINYVALKLQHIPELPLPLKVWAPGVSTTYATYSYPVSYNGQTPGQLLYATPAQDVFLKPGEPNALSIQVKSTLTAFLQFQIQISYRITSATPSSVLIFPQTFQVVFSDASNWKEYILQNGSFLEKS